MSQFLNALDTQEVSDKLFEVIDHPFQYQSDEAKMVITVPIGFQTDFASVPRFPLIYALLGDTAHEPAVIHDWLYYSAIVNREIADNVLYEAMTVFGVEDWRRDMIYEGVRAGGWYAWDEHRKEGHPEIGKFGTSVIAQEKESQ